METSPDTRKTTNDSVPARQGIPERDIKEIAAWLGQAAREVQSGGSGQEAVVNKWNQLAKDTRDALEDAQSPPALQAIRTNLETLQTLKNQIRTTGNAPTESEGDWWNAGEPDARIQALKNEWDSLPDHQKTTAASKAIQNEITAISKLSDSSRVQGRLDTLEAHIKRLKELSERMSRTQENIKRATERRKGTPSDSMPPTIKQEADQPAPNVPSPTERPTPPSSVRPERGWWEAAANRPTPPYGIGVRLGMNVEGVLADLADKWGRIEGVDEPSKEAFTSRVDEIKNLLKEAPSDELALTIREKINELKTLVLSFSDRKDVQQKEPSGEPASGAPSAEDASVPDDLPRDASAIGSYAARSRTEGGGRETGTPPSKLRRFFSGRSEDPLAAMKNWSARTEAPAPRTEEPEAPSPPKVGLHPDHYLFSQHKRELRNLREGFQRLPREVQERADMADILRILDDHERDIQSRETAEDLTPLSLEENNLFLGRREILRDIRRKIKTELRNAKEKGLRETLFPNVKPLGPAWQETGESGGAANDNSKGPATAPVAPGGGLSAGGRSPLSSEDAPPITSANGSERPLPSSPEGAPIKLTPEDIASYTKGRKEEQDSELERKGLLDRVDRMSEWYRGRSKGLRVAMSAGLLLGGIGIAAYGGTLAMPASAFYYALSRIPASLWAYGFTRRIQQSQGRIGRTLEKGGRGAALGTAGLMAYFFPAEEIGEVGQWLSEKMEPVVDMIMENIPIPSFSEMGETVRNFAGSAWETLKDTFPSLSDGEFRGFGDADTVSEPESPATQPDGSPFFKEPDMAGYPEPTPPLIDAEPLPPDSAPAAVDAPGAPVSAPSPFDQFTSLPDPSTNSDFYHFEPHGGVDTLSEGIYERLHGIMHANGMTAAQMQYVVNGLSDLVTGETLGAIADNFTRDQIINMGISSGNGDLLYETDVVNFEPLFQYVPEIIDLAKKVA